MMKAVALFVAVAAVLVTLGMAVPVAEDAVEAAAVESRGQLRVEENTAVKSEDLLREEEITAACDAGTHAIAPREDCRPTWIEHWPEFQTLAFTLDDVNMLCRTLKEKIVAEVTTHAKEEVDCALTGPGLTPENVVKRVLDLQVFERMHSCLAVEVENCGFQRIVRESVLQNGEVIKPETVLLLHNQDSGVESEVHLQRFRKAMVNCNKNFEEILRLFLSQETEESLVRMNLAERRIRALGAIEEAIKLYQIEIENIFMFGDDFEEN